MYPADRRREHHMSEPILIVDPNQFIQNMLGTIFRKLGLPSQALGDVQATVNLVAAQPVSFILMDATLPGVNTGQTIPYVQSIQPKPSPVIVMIQEGDPNPAGTLQLARGNGYLVKPFTENEIKTWLSANAEALLGRPWQPPAAGEDVSFAAGPDPAAVEHWIQALKSPDITEVIDALDNLVAAGATQAVQAIIDLSYEADGEIKISAIRALGKLGDHSATEAVVTNLNVPDQDLKEAALEALGDLKDPRALRPLSRILKVHDRNLLLLAIKALGMLQVEEAKDILEPLIHSQDQKIKASVQWAIRKIDGMDV